MRVEGPGEAAYGLPKNTPVKAPDEQFKQLLDQAVASREDKELKEAAKQFEALFVYRMLANMRESIPRGELIKESMGEKIFQSMFDQEVSIKAAETGNLGLAELIYQQLKNK